MNDALIAVRDADFGYDGAAVVRRASFDIRPGEFVAMVGSNGSGKTTLVRGLLGMLPVLGGALTRQSGLRIGYVPQREVLDAVYPLSAFDVALMGTYGELRGWRPIGRQRRQLTRVALEDARASEFAHRRYAELSGGQRQRVLMARALASQPDLLLLDEPTAGVDPETEALLLEAMTVLCKERALAVWMVTHRCEAVASHVDRVARVESGRVSLDDGACSTS